jgi:predicted molibdopterin-dependent oxidoreductase YjgC
VLGSSLDEATAARLALARELIVITSHEGPAVSKSTLALPGAVWVEKEGTFVNGDGHLQRFLQAVDIETGARPDASILSALLRRCRLSEGYEGPEDVFSDLARQVMPFFGLSYDTIPPGGVRLHLGIPPEEPR